MNPLFLVVFSLVFLFHLLIDMKRIRKQHKSIKWLYTVLYTLAGCMFLCILLGYELPMPTRFFLNYVSPRVFTFIYSF